MSHEEHDRRAVVRAGVRGAGGRGRSGAACRGAQSRVHARHLTDRGARQPRRRHRGQPRSTGPGEATLLTTVVSTDPIYAYFNADEQIFLRYEQVAARTARRSARRAAWPIQMALANEEGFPRDGRMDFLDNQLDPAGRHDSRPRRVQEPRSARSRPDSSSACAWPASASIAAVLVQDRAVGTDLGKKFVLVVDGPDDRIPHGHARARSSTGCAWCGAALERRMRRGASTACSACGLAAGRRDRASGCARTPWQTRRRGSVPNEFLSSSSSTARSSRRCSRCVILLAGGARAVPAADQRVPEVVPPTVVVRATYPGANPQVIAETVASPLEQQINGVEDMLYMFSQATTDGADDAHHHLRARHRSRQRAGAGAEPRRAGAAAAARRTCSGSAWSPRRRRPTS